MRTTMNLPDSLVAAAKARAARDGRTFTSLVEESLRARLAAPEPAPTPFELPSWNAGAPRIDLTDKNALWAALDEAP